MGNIKYKSAGAGSGKTFFLTHEIANVFRTHGSKANQIIVTTFTKAAAADIRAKAKKVMYEDPALVARAGELDQALIGTVHSIAYSFIGKYWYLLGMSPDVRVLEPDAVDAYISQSLADPSFISAGDRTFFNSFREFLELKTLKDGLTVDDFNYWQRDIKDLVNKATNYGLDDTDLEEDRKASHDLAEEIFGKGKAYPSKVEFVASLGLLHNVLDLMYPLTKAGKHKEEDKYYKALSDINDLEYGLGSSIGEKEIAGLSEIIVNFTDSKRALIDSSVIDLSDSLQYEDKLVETLKLINDYIDLIFDKVKAFRKRYDSFKKEMHFIDYDALEEKFSELLDIRQVQDDVKSQYRNVYVDEFQDSSPKQIEIFRKLADLIPTNYWVGDKKQAIYGFRGTNAELVQDVVDHIPAADVSTLDTSYRSVKPLVDASNNIFCELFGAKTPDEKKMIVLKTGRDAQFDKDNDIPEPVTSSNLIYWDLGNDNYSLLAKRIAALLQGEGCKSGKAPMPSDIAVLARKNSHLRKLSDKLHEYGIPVNIESENLIDTDEAKITVAMLHLLENPEDDIWAGVLAKMLCAGYNANKLISSRADWDKSNGQWLNDIDVIKAIRDMAYEARNMSISQMIQKLFIKTDIYNRIFSLSNGEGRRANLQTIHELSEDFEGHCAQLAIPATVGGFISYISDVDKTNAGDQTGVRLTTYHSSKGLEWPIVILTDLNETNLDDESLIEGEMMRGVKDYTIGGKTTVFLLRANYDRIKRSPVILGKAKAARTYLILRKSTAEEAKRLFYVGFTRAMNSIIIAGKVNRKESSQSEALEYLRELGMGFDFDTVFHECNLFKTGDMFEYCSGDPACATLNYSNSHGTIAITPNPKPAKDEARDYSPSQLEDGMAPARFSTAVENAVFKPVVYLGTPEDRIIPAKATPDNIFGDCIHHLYAIPEVWQEKPQDKIEEIAGQYGVKFKDNSKVALAYLRLIEYLDKTYGKATEVYHELAFKYQDPEGHIFTGSMDLVLDTPKGLVIVDYKTYQGTDLADHSKARRHPAQLSCYKEALESFLPGKAIAGTMIYYPVCEAVLEFCNI